MGTKRTLVVLDDVWERLIMEDLGIPCESGVKGCTVLLTSRDRDVFNAMNIQKVCALRILPQNESWFLFKDKVGTCINEVHLASIAEEVARECKGLPIALVTVGRALKGKKSKFIWEDALQQLKGSKAVDIPHVLAEVYNPLKLSYDFLDNRHARSVFLFCSLFPEDVDISLEHLTCRFLLLDGYDEHTVKMHDVVRDVAIFVASQEGRVGPNCSSKDWSLEQFYSDCTWISMFPQERVELPIVLNAPSLRLLLIDNSKESDTQMHDQYFEATKDLNVLSLRYISFKSLPQTIQLLENLLTLQLEFCALESISIIGELSSIEVLSFRSCHSIRELPPEIGRLTRLKLLEFSNCISLERVVPGVISKFVQLEELKMIGSFKGWEAEKNGKETRNASLNELQSLYNLRCLEIEIEDFTLASEEMRLSRKIVKYDIRFIKVLYLNLEGDGSNNLNLTQVQNTKTFDFRECSTMKKLVSTTSIDWRFGVFPVLEFLKLKDLPNLEEICNGPIQAGSNSFNNLKELEIFDLTALEYLWNSQNQNVSLSNLTFIYISGDVTSYAIYFH
ncbi:hypothetical protein BUALT_Bualt12G0032500 [Buddleja alternifolia]|uniref:NB-ARC domain-containing protein n=1 Tax=Buddleja alternifolia TaxID=168488 RepID=A0AAV6WNI2_9LAMI|nr:hypothetical protein BUALT_Bualt12G0032500 [Buddleja alternifolia]